MKMEVYPFGHPVYQMLRMGALRQASRGKVYPFGHPACQMLRMGALRQASRDKGYIFKGKGDWQR